MLPLGVALVTSAAVGLVSRVLPRWLAWVGLVVGLTALVNGTLLGSEGAWGFLIGIIWVFTGGTVLAMRGTSTMRHRSWPPPPADTTPAGLPPSCWTRLTALGQIRGRQVEYRAGRQDRSPPGPNSADKSNPAAVRAWLKQAATSPPNAEDPDDRGGQRLRRRDPHGLRRRLPIYHGKRDLEWYFGSLAAKEGRKGRMIAPATMSAPACSTINSVRARAERQGEKHARVIASTLRRR
jgi:hypothetical protein